MTCDDYLERRAKFFRDMYHEAEVRHTIWTDRLHTGMYDLKKVDKERQNYQLIMDYARDAMGALHIE